MYYVEVDNRRSAYVEYYVAETYVEEEYTHFHLADPPKPNLTQLNLIVHDIRLHVYQSCSWSVRVIRNIVFTSTGR